MNNNYEMGMYSIPEQPKKKSKKKIFLGLFVFILLITGVIVALKLTVLSPKNKIKKAVVSSFKAFKDKVNVDELLSSDLLQYKIKSQGGEYKFDFSLDEISDMNCGTIELKGEAIRDDREKLLSGKCNIINSGKELADIPFCVDEDYTYLDMDSIIDDYSFKINNKNVVKQFNKSYFVKEGFISESNISDFDIDIFSDDKVDSDGFEKKLGDILKNADVKFEGYEKIELGNKKRKCAKYIVREKLDDIETDDEEFQESIDTFSIFGDSFEAEVYLYDGYVALVSVKMENVVFGQDISVWLEIGNVGDKDIFSEQSISFYGKAGDTDIYGVLRLQTDKNESCYKSKISGNINDVGYNYEVEYDAEDGDFDIVLNATMETSYKKAKESIADLKITGNIENEKGKRIKYNCDDFECSIYGYSDIKCSGSFEYGVCTDGKKAEMLPETGNELEILKADEKDIDKLITKGVNKDFTKKLEASDLWNYLTDSKYDDLYDYDGFDYDYNFGNNDRSNENSRITITDGSNDNTSITDPNYFISGIYTQTDITKDWAENPDIKVKAGEELDMGSYTVKIDSFKEVDDISKEYLEANGAEAVYEVTYTVNNKSNNDTGFYADIVQSMSNIGYADSKYDSGMMCIKRGDDYTKDSYSYYGERLGVGSSETRTFYIAVRHAGKGCFLLKISDDNQKKVIVRMDVNPTK